MQCVTKGARITLGIVPHHSLETVSDLGPKLVHICQDARVEIGRLMAVREFFTTQAQQYRIEEDVSYLMPRSNTNTVIRALHEYADGKRGRVSELAMRGGEGKYKATYTIMITKRRSRKRKGSGPEDPAEEYIAFATNRPDADPNI